MGSWSPGHSVRLETKRFELKSLSPSDVSDEYLTWWNDDEIQAWFGGRGRGWTEQDARHFLRRFDNITRFHIGIFPKGEAIPIGFITIRPKDKGCVRTRTVIGNKAYWGMGVALEARACVFAFAFSELKAHKIYGEVDARNFPSIFNYKAQGFVCEGVLREQTPWPDGTWHDLVLFGLLKDEWVARNTGHCTGTGLARA